MAVIKLNENKDSKSRRLRETFAVRDSYDNTDVFLGSSYEDVLSYLTNLESVDELEGLTIIKYNKDYDTIDNAEEILSVDEFLDKYYPGKYSRVVRNESFKVSVTGNGDDNYSMAEIISDNAAGEYDAITGYEALLSKMMELGIPQEDLDQISEIISDEKNHAEVLHKMLRKYDNIETAKD